MSKLQYILLGAAALLMGACSSEEPAAPDPSTEKSVTVTLTAPEGFTRSAGDASSVDQLRYAVYDLSGSSRTLVEEGDITEEIDFPMSLDLKLITGRQYGLLFFAGNEDAPYTWNVTNGTLTVDYTKTTANSDVLDGFYAYETLKVEGNVTLNMTMERPFAMINIGANSEPAQGDVSSVTVEGAATGIDLTTGTLTGEGTNATFSAAAVPQEDTYPVEGYYYVAYTYVLAPKTSTTYTVSYTCGAAETSEPASSTIEGVTLQANFRTNIYGSLPNN